MAVHPREQWHMVVHFWHDVTKQRVGSCYKIWDSPFSTYKPTSWPFISNRSLQMDFMIIRFFSNKMQTEMNSWSKSDGNNNNVTRRQREGSVYLALAGNTSLHPCVDVQLLFQNLERFKKAVQPFSMHNRPRTRVHGRVGIKYTHDMVAQVHPNPPHVREKGRTLLSLSLQVCQHRHKQPDSPR